MSSHLVAVVAIMYAGLNGCNRQNEIEAYVKTINKTIISMISASWSVCVYVLYALEPEATAMLSVKLSWANFPQSTHFIQADTINQIANAGLLEERQGKFYFKIVFIRVEKFGESTISRQRTQCDLIRGTFAVIWN